MTGDVVVTGLGVVAPNGLGVDEFWKATLAGDSGISELDRFDCRTYSSRLAGQITGFDARDHLPGLLLKQTDRVTQLALAAADWALDDAGARTAMPADFDCGVVTSNATGGFEFSHREFQKLWTSGPEEVSVYQCFAWFYAVNTGQISIKNRMRGTSSVIVSEQAGGLDALGHARRTIRRGNGTLMVTGGMESSFDPWGWVSHLASNRVSREPDASRAYLPFDRRANGYVPGEGGAILVVEEAAAANRRSALLADKLTARQPPDGSAPPPPARIPADRPYGQISGYASTFDPPPGSGRPPGLRRAMELALADADLRPDQVDLVVADAAGVPELDALEAGALRAVFGPRGVPVCAPKSMMGRLMAGGGPLDVVCALLAIRDGMIPPAVNVDTVVPEYEIDLVVGEPRSCPVSTVLVLARGIGGFNSAVVVQRF